MNVVWVIIVSLVFRIAFASSIGLGVDETYMVAAGRELQLSYFDHPPLAWWIVWATHHLTGSISPLVLRLPFIGIFALSTWLLFRLTENLCSPRAGFWAAMCFNLSPVFLISTGSWILPDGPLVAAMLAAALCLSFLFTDTSSSRPWLWLLAGLFGGVALLSKYHGIFIFTGALLFVVTSRDQRHWLRSPWPYAGAALGLIVFSPVLIWNAEHHWVSFLFQGARTQATGLTPMRVLRAIIGHALYLAPWIWLPLMVVAWQAWKRGTQDRASWLMLCLAMGPIFVFSITPLWTTGQLLPHWAAPGYLMLVPILGAAMAEYAMRPQGQARLRSWLVGSTVFILVAATLIGSEARYAWMGRAMPALAQKGDPLRELLDWHDLKAELTARGMGSSHNMFILAPRWHEAARISYALQDDMPVLCLSPDPREFDVLNHAPAMAGRDALILGANLNADLVNALYGKAFSRIEPTAPFIITHAGHPAIVLKAYLASDFHPEARPLGWNQ